MSCPVSDMGPHFPIQPNQCHWGYNPVQYVLVIITSCLSRIWFFGSITWTLGYFADLILFAFTSSFLPSESHAGESLLSELSRGLRIWFFSFVFWTSKYLADLIFRTVSTPCGIEFHLSRFTYLIFCLYWRLQSFILVSIPCLGESVTSQAQTKYGVKTSQQRSLNRLDTLMIAAELRAIFQYPVSGLS